MNEAWRVDVRNFTTRSKSKLTNVVDPPAVRGNHCGTPPSMSKTKSIFSEVKQPPSADPEREQGKRPLKRKADLKDLRSLVGEVRAEDGVDPRDEARRRSRSADDTRLGEAHGTHRQGQVLS